LGREIVTLVDGIQRAGTHVVEWKADRFPSGIYICRLEAMGKTTSRKMLLLR
jgi:hypothetical protein